jgi:hypothetical protein
VARWRVRPVPVHPVSAGSAGRLLVQGTRFCPSCGGRRRTERARPSRGSRKAGGAGEAVVLSLPPRVPLGLAPLSLHGCRPGVAPRRASPPAGVGADGGRGGHPERRGHRRPGVWRGAKAETSISTRLSWTACSRASGPPAGSSTGRRGPDVLAVIAPVVRARLARHGFDDDGGRSGPFRGGGAASHRRR